MICISLSARTNAELYALIRKGEAQPADVVELRLDALAEPPDVEGLVAYSARPVMISCYSRREGGGFAGGDRDRVDILKRAVRVGCAYLSVEPGDIPYLSEKRPQTVLIACLHDFTGVPANLEERIRDIAALPCDWVKFAVTHRRATDSVRVLENIERCPKPCIGIAMGAGGLLTHVLGPMYGSKMTFGCLDAGQETAPGQPTVYELAKIYRVKTITPDTRVYGLIGNPVVQSKGYRLHNRAFERLGFDGVYIPFWCASAEDFLDAMAGTINLHGLSVTIPHKPAALRWAQDHSETAARLGAANTLTLTDAGWRADNTDMPAIFKSVKEATDGVGMNLMGAPALILGSGGTTRAAGMALALLGCAVTVASRSAEKSWQLAGFMGWDAEDLDIALRGNWRVVANTTPVGMYPDLMHESPFPADNWREGMLAFDAVHNPQQTVFLRDAATAGAVTVDGVEMFLRQAAEQFELWTGREMPRISSLTWPGR